MQSVTHSPGAWPGSDPEVASRVVDSIALISGGLDSIVATALAVREGEVRLAITVDYGQRAAVREIEASREVCTRLGVTHETIDARWLAGVGGGALLEPDLEVPEPELHELSGDAAKRSAAAVWVPNRNGVLANIAAARADATGADAVIVGFNAEEAETFADNSVAFLEALERSFAYSTRNGVRVHAPLATRTKSEILVEARRIDAPVELAWPCYRGGASLCGTCESCRRFRRALAMSGTEAWYNERLRG